MVSGRVIAIGGLSGSGKTTLAAAITAKMPNTVHLDSDQIRKEMLGIPWSEKLPEEAYAWEVTQKMIDETFRRASEAIDRGQTVIFSALYSSDRSCGTVENFAASKGVPFYGFFLETDLKTLFARVTARKNDASDAGIDQVTHQAGFSTADHRWHKLDGTKPVKHSCDAVEKTLFSQVSLYKALPRRASPSA